MSPLLLFSFVIAYFLLLLGVAWYTSRNSDNESFFIGNRSSNWMLVAFGMIGTSLSGVTFVSVPGAVKVESFAYFQITIGYLLGYLTIAYVLLPLYYALNVTSIYNYLNTRLGFSSYKTGASFFILSRTLGATARLYLVVKILQDAILAEFGIPFWLTTLVILIMILLYTYEGGVKTIVYTDTLQTTCMLAGLVICTIYILNSLNISLGESLQQLSDKGYSKIFFSDPMSRFFFLKQVLAGAFITITMTGMDQEMMQKNISVKTLKDSQKNMVTIGFIMLVVIGLFLFMGGLLYLYADQFGVTATGDKLFPEIALHHLPPFVSVIFIIALISALFPSADGAITALTSSFCIDILGIKRRKGFTEAQQNKTRKNVHLVFALIFLVFVLVFRWINSPSMIGVILKVAAYTYGPLLGLFTFGLITKRVIKGNLVPLVCIAAPIISYLVDINQKRLFNGYEIGLELLVLNGFLTFIGLLAISRPSKGGELPVSEPLT
ncbi:sodium:solute symporter [Segetibacter sp. 3557_3]|uniref:sodium:solute symporter n=1 Tax=Segetibacter sp. 3557_3 TaxID=2547429 RepID=UPI001058D94D|nr:sodium:solute symporter [Segetibacter sp. 3557_3]TDH27866.1 sodium:solute symporter [Segetibacter sp. 3557_3]